MKKLLLSLILGTLAIILLLTEHGVFSSFLFSLALLMGSTGHKNQNTRALVKPEIIFLLVFVLLLVVLIFMTIKYPNLKELIDAIYSHPLFALTIWILFMISWMRRWREYKRNRDTLSPHNS